MSKRSLFLISTYYLLLPLCIFLCAWVNFWIGIPLAAILALTPVLVARGMEGKTVFGNRKMEAVILIVLFLWVFCSGIGGYVWQNRWDHLFRNAVFTDLVERPWPVQNGSSIMTYYFGFWLFPALCGKITGNIEVGWFMQLVYAFIGILLAFRLTVEKIGNVKLRYLLPFILFSGVDIAYYLIFGLDISNRGDYHIELWNDISFYESNTTLINWVYNQAIPSWVATMIIINFGRRPGVAPLTLCFLIISAPFSVVGLFPLALYYVGVQALNPKTLSGAFKVIFSPYNIIAVMGVIPLYILMRLNVNTGFSFGTGHLNFLQWLRELWWLILIEIGVFIPFIWKQVRRSAEFWILLATCVSCLLIIMGGKYADFNGRVELPLNFFMTLQIAVFLGRWKRAARSFKAAFLVVAAFAVVTPALESARLAYYTVKAPREEYRSFEVHSIFEPNRMRHNFVADSIISEKALSNQRAGKVRKFLFRFDNPEE